MESMKHELLGASLLCGLSLVARAQQFLVSSPASGELGTVVRLEVVPRTAGYELSSETFGGWVGTYSSSGGTTPVFSVTYAGADIRVVDDWTAEVVLGAGVYAAAGAIDFTTLANSGTLGGTFILSTPRPCAADINQDDVLNFFDVSAYLTAFNAQDPVADFAAPFGVFNFFDISAFLSVFTQGCGPSTVNTSGPVSIGMTVEPAEWRFVYYPGGWAFGLEAQLLPDPADQIGVFSASRLPSVPANDSLLGLSGAIYGVTLDVESNAWTMAGDPSMIRVDVFTVDGSGMEIDRINGLELANEGVVDGRVRFSSRSLKNVLFADEFIDDSQLTSLVTILAAPSGGAAFVVLDLGK